MRKTNLSIEQELSQVKKLILEGYDTISWYSLVTLWQLQDNHVNLYLSIYYLYCIKDKNTVELIQYIKNKKKVKWIKYNLKMKVCFFYYDIKYWWDLRFKISFTSLFLKTSTEGEDLGKLFQFLVPRKARVLWPMLVLHLIEFLVL